MLIPIVLQIGTPPAWAASPFVQPAVAAIRFGQGAPLQIPGVAVPLAWPSLALPSAPALNFGVAPEALAAVFKALLGWPIAVFASLAAWLIRLRQTRWSRIAVAAEPGHALGEPAQVSELLLFPEVVTPRAQVQGVDLAARARFVAMTFAFPETSLSRHRPTSWPLDIDCQPTRFTLTLHHAALNYRLEFCNRGADALGPLIIRADLVAAEDRIGHEHRIDFAAAAMPLCHYVDNLATGDSIELTGELRLPLAGISPMRLGTAELLVPLLRLCAESPGEIRPALSVSACFAIGMPPLAAGGGIQPFRLDSGPGIWRKLTTRRVNDDDLA